MKKRLALLLCVFSMSVFAQKGNTILFIEASGGGAIKNTGNVNFSIHYQYKTSLYSFRFSKLHPLDNGHKTFILALPIVALTGFASSPIKGFEYTVLYGKRFVKNDFSYSFSTGISYTKFTKFPKITTPIFEDSFAGIPLEINVRWFKSVKEKFKILGLIPVGKPTSFGGSIGVKLFGNISKKSYVGLGVIYGLGYYKNYN